MRGTRSAAISTALYPATVACEDSASMLCARVMRGISSIENAVAPVRASSCIARGEPSGSRKPITVCAERSDCVSPARTRSSTSLAKTSSRATSFAPLAVYASSAKPAAVPAPDSTSTSAPAAVSEATIPGTSATRFSAFAVSRGTPIFMSGSDRGALWQRAAGNAAHVFQHLELLDAEAAQRRVRQHSLCQIARLELVHGGFVREQVDPACRVGSFVHQPDLPQTAWNSREVVGERGGDLFVLVARHGEIEVDLEDLSAHRGYL